MLGLNRLSIKSRLLLILLLVSISSVVGIGVLSYRYAQNVIRERIFAQLTSVRVARAYEIETYLTSVIRQAGISSQDATVVQAMVAFDRAFRSLNLARELSADQTQELLGYYETSFLPRLEATLGTGDTGDAAPVAATYLPDSNAGRYVQYAFIVRNPQPEGQKDDFDTPPEASSYSVAHGQYHGTFQNMPKLFGFYDVFLIDLDGNVVYSVFKEVDLGTNLNTGPYRGSGLARVFRAALDAPDPGTVVLEDFSFYRPSYGAPASFMAAPIYKNNELLGVLAFQGPVDDINRIMTGGYNWRASGLGDTGETYLVGDDGLLRSPSRLLLEEPETYFGALAELAVDDSVQDRLRSTGSPLLLQPSDTGVARAALDGDSGTREAVDFRGVRTLSSFAPLELPAPLHWGMVAELDLAEAYAPLRAFQKLLYLSVAALVVLITALAMFLANLFTRPINRFVEGAEAITEGAEAMPVTSRDEFGRLALSLNRMVGDLRARTQVERERGDERAALIATLLPSKVAERLNRGDEDVVERYPNVSVLFADLHGFGALSEASSPEEGSALLNGLVTLFDEAAAAHGVEKVKTLGADYLAVCGASVSRLDHGKRMVDFAEEMQRQVQFFAQQHGFTLSLSVGIAAGSVDGGLVGRSRLAYDLWGKPVDEAVDLSAEAAPGSILIADSLKEGLDDVALEPVSTTFGDAWTLASAAESPKARA